jgi:uncharacterized membrane-anchored protein YitT (DUF2179 family)
MKKFLQISLGNFIYTVAVAFFILPNDLLTGGTTGLALFAQYMFHIPITAFVYAFNIAMFLLGAWVLGKQFALTTILSTFEYPIFLSVLQLIAAHTGPLTTDKLLATIFAGTLIGIGIGMVIQAGASTGGMDIPPLVLEKKTGIPVSGSLYVFDFTILLLQFLISDKEQILYGILLVLLYTMILDKVLINGKRQIQLKIISPDYESINKIIQAKLDRGTTLLSIHGGYSGTPSNAVLTVVSPNELFKVQELVHNIDPNAFITINEVREVRGRGFSLQKEYH